MKRLICAAAAAALLAGPARAAVVIDFDSLAAPGFMVNVVDGYVEDGLAFNSSQPGYLFSWGSDQAFNADPGGAVMSVIGGNLDLVVTAAAGGTFDLISFDLSTGFNEKKGSVPFTYTDSLGVTHASSLKLDDKAGLETITFNLAGITRFTLKAAPPKMFQVDNVVVDFPVSAAPEPGAWALMVAGFGLAGAALRRRRLMTANA